MVREVQGYVQSSKYYFYANCYDMSEKWNLSSQYKKWKTGVSTWVSEHKIVYI